ncbi:SWI/SNF chromatin-remodeling complex subunit [Boothiomyces sp. JEL0838]|nr:SWI/SNF chromatin-remodeling complex subunit [Boothiomyces sp. JEL0838]KAJ3313568.1 SWI/SNF chromatin-remodeling complex subunit [Boothiomyces sp. JEL0838]
MEKVKEETKEEIKEEKLSEAELKALIHREEAYNNHLQYQTARFQNLQNIKMQERQDILRQYQFQQSQPQRLPPAKEPKLAFTEKELADIATKNCRLVPIRIDIEMDGYKLRDTFTWNLYENLITPEMFAKVICDDCNIDQKIAPTIARAIREQVEDYFQHAPANLEYDESLTQGNDGIDPDNRDLPELRMIIKLDITIDHQCIVDQFEWDLACRRNNPEVFAENLVKELGLVPEFITCIAHSIREQVHAAARSLLIANHDFLTPGITDEQLAATFLPQLQAVKRTLKEYNEFGPYVSKPSAQEIEKMEKDLERENRRKRRQTQRSRRMVILTEKESSKTNRTPLPVPLKLLPAKTEIEQEENEDEQIITKTIYHPIPLTLCDPCGVYWAKTGGLP